MSETSEWIKEQFKAESAAKLNVIEMPAHYNPEGIQPAEFMESLGIAEDYYAGNIIKYAARYKHKNGVEDIKKAKQYCKMLIDLLESQT